MIKHAQQSFLCSLENRPFDLFHEQTHQKFFYNSSKHYLNLELALRFNAHPVPETTYVPDNPNVHEAKYIEVRVYAFLYLLIGLQYFFISIANNMKLYL